MRSNEGEKIPQAIADDESKSSPLSLLSKAAGGHNALAGDIDLSDETQKSPWTAQCPTCGLAVTPGTQVCPIDGTPLSDTPAPGLSGQYQFIDVLGQGGMATVHRARHLLLGHTVAIKLLNPSAGFNSVAVRRFR